jgi:hypothetical protein
MSAETEPATDEPQEEVISPEFMAKCLSKCSQYRAETKKEKDKRRDFRDEIRQEFGDSVAVQNAIASMDSRTEEHDRSLGLDASLPTPKPYWAE